MLQFCIATAREPQGDATIGWHELPAEARETVKLMRQGGPFPYPKDGSVFGNYERVLPKQKRGYYHEFTVKTPGLASRGARRIVAGGDWKTTRELYYTTNHYASFRRIKE
ncbi:ribonuclease domain-containing protein [Lacisediminimonas sp.]|uniref:ribonuclease domain-containing protein n=1 Tax=Lacisediminimonas sp. TaxID=3060582 RepID=UPI00272A85EB|nr:ribonuclease domain-containing protein [Lacisediminimonas sp.]